MLTKLSTIEQWPKFVECFTYTKDYIWNTLGFCVSWSVVH